MSAVAANVENVSATAAPRGSTSSVPRLGPVEYVRAGMALVRIPSGLKGPEGPGSVGWNRKENCITDVEAAELWKANIGLAHAYSGTCAIDIDDLERSRILLNERGVDLDAMLNAPDAVRIVSGKANRAKLIYSLAEPLASHAVTEPHPKQPNKRNTVLEFRCASSGGLTMQDVLPPSRLDDGRCYTWNVGPSGDALKPPPLPDALRRLWGSFSTIDGVARAPMEVAESLERFKLPTGLSEEESWQTLRAADADDYHTWIKAGMALQHEHGDAGFRLWVEFSERSAKFPGLDECWDKWQTFGRQAGPPLTMRAFIKMANEAKAKAAAAAGERPVIRLEAGELHTYATQAEQLLATDAYVRGGKLVRIGTPSELPNTAGQTITREPAQAVVVPISAEWLQRTLTERAQFQVYRAREKKWVAQNCPADLARNILGQNTWPSFPPLTAIAAAPFIRPDGSVWESAGYDTETGIYCQPSEAFPPIPTAPTRDDARAALQRICAPFDQFPFDSEASKATFAAHILTACARPVISTSPVFFYTAPMPATGKTLISTIPNRIANGTAPPLRPFPAEGDELRKVLFSAVLAGDTALAFDNVTNGTTLGSPQLCAFATADVYSDRKLGVSETAALPNRCILVLTGNNVTPSSDLSRRSLVCRLDVNAESARGRSFRIPDLPEYVRRHRAELLVDALTILRAYAIADDPERRQPLESFEQWSKLVRDPLLWLGMADPVSTQETETEDELQPLRAAFEAIAGVTADQNHQFTSATLAEKAAGIDEQAEQLRRALSEAECNEPTDSRKLGAWLRGHRGRVARGWKLSRKQGETNVWSLRCVAA